MVLKYLILFTVITGGIGMFSSNLALSKEDNVRKCVITKKRINEYLKEKGYEKDVLDYNSGIPIYWDKNNNQYFIQEIRGDSILFIDYELNLEKVNKEYNSLVFPYGDEGEKISLIDSDNGSYIYFNDDKIKALDGEAMFLMDVSGDYYIRRFYAGKRKGEYDLYSTLDMKDNIFSKYGNPFYLESLDGDIFILERSLEPNSNYEIYVYLESDFSLKKRYTINVDDFLSGRERSLRYSGIDFNYSSVYFLYRVGVLFPKYYLKIYNYITGDFDDKYIGRDGGYGHYILRLNENFCEVLDGVFVD